MKKILLAAAVLVGSNAMAQIAGLGTVGESKKVEAPKTLSLKTPTDTLQDFFANAARIVGSVDGGYVFGVNDLIGDFGMSHQVQGYIVEDAYSLEGAMIWVGAKLDSVWSNDSTSSFGVNIFDLDQANEDFDPKLPPLAGVTVPFHSVSDTTYLFVTFDTPIWRTQDYGIGMDFSTLNFGETIITTDTLGNADTTIVHGDTLGIVSDGEFNGDGLRYNWLYAPRAEQGWYAFGDAWTNWDEDFGIFPIIEYNVSIEEAKFISGLKVETYPNPTSEVANVRFELEETADKVMFEVYTMAGQRVINQNLGSKNADAIHTTTVDLSNLAAGTYVYSLNADGKRMTQKLIIE
jgi:hypothetical protein